MALQVPDLLIWVMLSLLHILPKRNPVDNHSLEMVRVVNLSHYTSIYMKSLLKGIIRIWYFVKEKLLSLLIIIVSFVEFLSNILQEFRQFWVFHLGVKVSVVFIGVCSLRIDSL